MNSGAKFSSCKKYRYRLWRIWDDQKPVMVFCMLNPSTADEVENDPTVARCQERAKRNGYGGIEVVNIFAFRSTDPRALYRAQDPIGPENNGHIKDALKSASTVICAWGKHGELSDRGVEVLKLILNLGHKPMALKINKDGSPGHPLYVGYDVKPVEYLAGNEAGLPFKSRHKDE